jgi:hypothetical protein
MKSIVSGQIQLVLALFAVTAISCGKTNGLPASHDSGIDGPALSVGGTGGSGTGGSTVGSGGGAGRADAAIGPTGGISGLGGVGGSGGGGSGSGGAAGASGLGGGSAGAGGVGGQGTGGRAGRAGGTGSGGVSGLDAGSGKGGGAGGISGTGGITGSGGSSPRDASDDISITCGTKTCGSDERCCSNGCNVCVPQTLTCSLVACSPDDGGYEVYPTDCGQSASCDVQFCGGSRPPHCYRCDNSVLAAPCTTVSFNPSIGNIFCCP